MPKEADLLKLKHKKNIFKQHSIYSTNQKIIQCLFKKLEDQQKIRAALSLFLLPNLGTGQLCGPQKLGRTVQMCKQST